MFAESNIFCNKLLNEIKWKKKEMEEATGD